MSTFGGCLFEHMAFNPLAETQGDVETRSRASSFNSPFIAHLSIFPLSPTLFSGGDVGQSGSLLYSHRACALRSKLSSIRSHCLHTPHVARTWAASFASGARWAEASFWRERSPLPCNDAITNHVRNTSWLSMLIYELL